MDVHDVKLTISAVAAAQYPEDGHPEIAFWAAVMSASHH